MNGFINLYKPSGISSALCLNKIKKRFKGVKIGHTGTLDPMACGLLPVAVGKSTRLFDYLLDKDKIYKAVFTFGYETDSLDATGNIIKESNIVPTKEQILSVIPSLIGEIDQIPPVFSAKNVNGQRSYDLARKGVIVELKSKKVVINSIKIIDKVSENAYSFLIECKGGTYIRSICRDIAYKLNAYGTMTFLERQKSGAFTLENSYTLEEINSTENLEKIIIQPDKVLNYQELRLSGKTLADLLNGRPCFVQNANGLYKVYGDNEFIGVGLVENSKLIIKAFVKD